MSTLIQPINKDATYAVSKICEHALQGCIEDQEYLQKLLKLHWWTIKETLESNYEKKSWNKFWTTLVKLFEKAHQ